MEKKKIAVMLIGNGFDLSHNIYSNQEIEKRKDKLLDIEGKIKKEQENKKKKIEKLNDYISDLRMEKDNKIKEIEEEEMSKQLNGETPIFINSEMYNIEDNYSEEIFHINVQINSLKEEKNKLNILYKSQELELIHSNNMKTSYKDFLGYISEKVSHNKLVIYLKEHVSVYGWIDIENEIGTLISLFQDFRLQYECVNIKTEIDLKYYKLAKYFSGDDIIFTTNYNSLRPESFNIKFRREIIANIDRFIIQFIAEIKEIMKEMSIYFNSINPGIESVFWISKLSMYSDIITLNFNYTDTINLYSKYNIDIYNNYCHGDVQNLILGTNFDCDSDFAFFNKNIQVLSNNFGIRDFIKSLEIIENLKISRPKNKFTLGGVEQLDFIIAGHSCDTNDAKYIDEFFRVLDDFNENCEQVKIHLKIYYYSENDLNVKLNNLSKILKINESESKLDAYHSNYIIENIKITDNNNKETNEISK